MAAFLAPLLGGGFKVIEDLIKIHKMNEWAKLIVSFAFSYCTSFSFVCGSALAAKQPPLVAIGAGMVSGSLMATIVFRRSPLTKGMMFALPADEAAKEMDANVQVGMK